MGRYYIILLYLCFISLNITQAQTHTWTGNGDGVLWSDPLNWDIGTIPLSNGIGNVIIPTGNEVTNDNVVYFKAGEISGGGSLFNNGNFHMVNDSEINATKIISNIDFDNLGNIYIYQSTGITNSEPIYLNNGTEIFTCHNCEFSINNIGITTSTPANPGFIDINGPFNKIGSDTVNIDVKLRICCYDFEVIEGLLIIESKYNNLILSPHILISENAGLIFSGNNIFNSGAAVEGANEGYLEIKDNPFGNPIIPSTYFYEVEGLLTINSSTFSGGGSFRIQNADAIFTGTGDVTLDNVTFWVQSETGTLTLGTGTSFSVNLINGGRILSGGNIFLNGANIIGTGSINDRLSIGGVLSVTNNSLNHHFNGINLTIFKTLNLNDGTILMDDTSFFENYFYQNPEFPDIIEYGEVLGSGLFRFPIYNSSTVQNNGVFNPSPEISTLHTINYSQTNTGKIFIDINSLSEYDVISNIGASHISGDFEINLNFSPSIGNEFEVFISSEPITECTVVSTTATTFNGLTYVFDVICNSTSIVLKLGAILKTEDFFKESLFVLSPNPARNVISFEYSPTILQEYSQLKIEIYNTFGQRTSTIHVAEEFTILNVSQFKSGIYVARLYSGKTTLAISKFVKL